MRFSNLYNNQPFRFSVEVFPPKTDDGSRALFRELEALRVIDPAYVSVTYGAMGSTREFTKDLATRVQKTLGFNTAFHFTCVGSGREDIKAYIGNMAANGLKLIVALRGDRPQDPGYCPPADGFRYANELVAYLKQLDDFSIAVAGYPEKHIEAKDLVTDIAHLKRKVDAGADVVITQLFFDNADFYSWVDKVRAAGVKVPIIAGILPVQSLKQIQKITGLCGARLPAELLRRLESCGEDAAAVRAVGVEHAVKQCQNLIDNGVVGIHFYCLNRADSILKIVQGLRFPASA